MTRTAAWGMIAGLILLPLTAGLATGAVVWNGEDFPFVFLAVLLALAGGLYELSARFASHRAYSAGVGIAGAAAFILLWMNLAVGIIGNEDDPLNRLYGAVLAVGVAGVILARFKPGGMARAMAATALAQLLVAVVAQAAGEFTWVLTGFFTALWLLSASLFRQAAQFQTAVGATR